MNLDERMKRYEATTNICLTRRMPVVMRFDMKAGHTFTRGLAKPFDNVYVQAMQQTMEALCKDIQGCVFGYTQSDEISLVLIDYQTLETDAWFDYRLEKICSIGASKATRYFNKFFYQITCDMVPSNFEIYKKKFWEAEFDCRAFNVPKEDVCNCILWRQQDAEKNSVQSLAQSLFSQSELNGVNNKALQDKMFTEKDVNWNDMQTYLKRGSACKKNDEGKWYIDYDMPILSRNREYLESTIML